MTKNKGTKIMWIMAVGVGMFIVVTIFGQNIVTALLSGLALALILALAND